MLDAICREDHNQTRVRNSAANHSILRRMALNAHNRMPGTGKRRNSLPKRELRAALNPAYLEQLLSLVEPPCELAIPIALAPGLQLVYGVPAGRRPLVRH